MITKEKYIEAREIVEQYEMQMHINYLRCKAICYTELKAFMEEKKRSPRLCGWDDVHHQEIWDKMLELEKKYENHTNRSC